MKHVLIQPNLRNQQRVDVTAKIIIERPNSGPCDGTTVNLSRTGVMIVCDQATAQQLTQGNRAFAPGTRSPVQARFTVPLETTSPDVVAKGNIVHFRRVAQNRFQLGIQFEEFEGSGFECVDQFVRHCLDARSQSD